MMEEVGIGYAVHGSVDGNGEEENVSEISNSRGYSWNHSACTECLDKQDKWHNGENIMVGGEGCQPMDCKISNPDHEDGEVYWQNPEH